MLFSDFGIYSSIRWICMTLYLKFIVTDTRAHPKRVECFRHVSEFCLFDLYNKDIKA
jgi:hypothetical protein